MRLTKFLNGAALNEATKKTIKLRIKLRKSSRFFLSFGTFGLFPDSPLTSHCQLPAIYCQLTTPHSLRSIPQQLHHLLAVLFLAKYFKIERFIAVAADDDVLGRWEQAVVDTAVPA